MMIDGTHYYQSVTSDIIQISLVIGGVNLSTIVTPEPFM